MEFSHFCNAYFRWCIEMHQRKVQGQMALKALAFKAFGFVQYVLINQQPLIQNLSLIGLPLHQIYQKEYL